MTSPIYLWPDFSVSHETEKGLRQFTSLVQKRGTEINLVGKRDLDRLWQRHILDSAQLAPLLTNAGAQKASRILDLGSGAGLPGMVLALLLPETELHLVEPSPRRAQFLRETAAQLDAGCIIHETRVEALELDFTPDFITARALAPLPTLLSLTAAFHGENTKAFFPKGENWQKELTESLQYWRINPHTHDSRTNAKSVILEIPRPIALERGQHFVPPSPHFRNRQSQRRRRQDDKRG